MINVIDITGVVKDAPVLINDYNGNKLYSFKLSFKSRETDTSESQVEVRVQESTGGFSRLKVGKFVRVHGSLRNKINHNKKPRVVTIIYADYINFAERGNFINKVELSGNLSAKVFDMNFSNSYKSFCRRNLVLSLRGDKTVTVSLLGWGRMAARLGKLQSSGLYYTVCGRLSGHSYKYREKGTYKTCNSVEVVIDSCFGVETA